MSDSNFIVDKNDDYVRLNLPDDVYSRFKTNLILMLNENPDADWILKYHEIWNGCGYPLGFKGKEIPLACLILAIADTYDAITNDRPYRKARSHAQAVVELRRCAGIQFDPYLIDQFIYLLENKLIPNSQ